MSEHFSPLFPAEVVECVAGDREPTEQELYSLANRIGQDAGLRPIFAWSEASAVSDDRLFLLRAAHLALHGAG